MFIARSTVGRLLIGAATFAVVPSAVAKDWPDPLVNLAGTPQNVAQGMELDAYQLGLSAYVWGYPLVRMERVIRDYVEVPNPKPATSYRAPLNRIGWARELATPSALDMPTANNDTTYLSAVVDLASGPYVLSVPDVGKPLLRRRRVQHVAGTSALRGSPDHWQQSGTLCSRSSGVEGGAAR